MPINSETAIQNCFIKIALLKIFEHFQETFMLEHYFNEVWNKELQLFENSNPPQVLSREFSKMLGTAICRLPETAL